MSEHILNREAIYLAGIWLTLELSELLIILTREAQEHYDRHSDEDILSALDFMDLEPETAAQFLEGFMYDRRKGVNKMGEYTKESLEAMTVKGLRDLVVSKDIDLGIEFDELIDTIVDVLNGD